MNIKWFDTVRWLLNVFIFKRQKDVRVSGLENIPELGRVILISNHISNYDAPFIACSINRRFHAMAKVELYKNKVFGRLLYLLGAFPVKRGEGDIGAIKMAMKILKREDALLIFPEGTRGNGKEILSFNSGFAVLAEKMNAPVVPVYLSGTECLGGKSSSKSPLVCNIGVPRYFEKLEGCSAEVSRSSFIDQCYSDVVKLKNNNVL